VVKCDEKQGNSTQEVNNLTEKQGNSKQEVESKTEDQQGNIKQHFEELWIRMLTMGKSLTCGDAVIVGPVYKIDISVGGVPSRALVDSGSQVCIVRKQLLPYIKESKEWGLPDCLQQHLPFDAQPVGAEGSALGALALVRLEITIAATDKCLEIPCYVMDSSKPIWQGETKNCGVIIGTNALVAFDFSILMTDGSRVEPASSQEDRVRLCDSESESKFISSETYKTVFSPIEPVTTTQPTESQELVVSSQGYNCNPLYKSSSVLGVVLKCATQVMPGQTIWIDVEATEDDNFLTSNITAAGVTTEDDHVILTPEQSTEFVPAKSLLTFKCRPDSPSPSSHFGVRSLQVAVPDEKILIDEHCDFIGGICNHETLSKVPVINWGREPKVLRRGAILGHIEQASLVEHGDPLWSDPWSELPARFEEPVMRMCQNSEGLNQLKCEIKIGEDCSSSERQELLDSLLDCDDAFALNEDELGETDIVEHFIDTKDAKPVREIPRRLPYALRTQLEEELDKLQKIKCIEPATSPYASPIVFKEKEWKLATLCGLSECQ